MENNIYCKQIATIKSKFNAHINFFYKQFWLICYTCDSSALAPDAQGIRKNDILCSI